MTNIILCGGSGTRLWPLSHKLMPKQFIKLFDEQSLFELTVKRNQPICKNALIVSNAEQFFLAKEQLDELAFKKTQYLLEPIGKNTAPAIALSCFALDHNEIILVTPSDHLIKDEENYADVVGKAIMFAKEGNLVTFGITPKYAHTGYGYIEASGEDVKSFHEKPSLESAQDYIKNRNFYWNSGIFCFQAGIFLEELKTYAPEIYKSSKEAFNNANKDGIIRIRHEDMSNIPEDSIDYAVMEKSSKVKVVKSEMQWSDLGGFEALHDEMLKDTNLNTLHNNLRQINSNNNFLYTHKKEIVLIDVDNIIIVETEDALLISKQGSSQKVKKIIQELK